MKILGISAYYHDSAAALLHDGRLVAAAQEERFSRLKNDASFPHAAVETCLREAGLRSVDEIDALAFYESTLLKLERIVETHLACAPRGLRSYRHSMPKWLQDKAWLADTLRDELGCDAEIVSCTHHESHAASAFFPSPFDRATVVTVDGVGEWATAAWALADGNRLEMGEELRFPHSLGLLYSAFTHHLGFAVNRDEYKVMGLAPYGEPRFVDAIRDELVEIREDGSFRLYLERFEFLTSVVMTGAAFERAVGVPRRAPGEPLRQEHRDLAASLQAVTEEIVRRIATYAVARTGVRKLCLAGGVALNSVANGKLLREGCCDGLWVQPAAGDAGGAIGAAYHAWHVRHGAPRPSPRGAEAQAGSLLGPRYDADEIRAFLDDHGYPYRELAEPTDLYAHVAELLDRGRIVGWLQGRMEFGPRALGARSILADPRLETMRSHLNERIKGRESFRPFAPAVLDERAGDYFEPGHSEHMTIVAPVLQGARAALPATTHVDGSARAQTVKRETNPAFHALLSAFESRTGCAALLNTSFNGRDEPIVCSPRDAYRCFRTIGLDHLVLDRFVLDADTQPPRAPRMGLRPDESPADFFTIYVLGGSTAAGEPYEPEVDLGRLIGAFFGGEIAGKPVRVVNLAHAARTSDDVADMVKRVPASASLIVVYTGHNELLHVRERFVPKALSYLLDSSPPVVARPAFGERTRRRLRRRFEANLRAAVEHARAIGVPVVVSTAASNVAGWPPNRSAVAGPLRRRRARRLVLRAERQAAAGERDAAISTLERLIAFAPELAWAHWRLGRLLPGTSERAARHLQLAVDHDASPLRADSTFNETTRRVCARLDVPLVDAVERLREAAGGPPGYDLFWDNCHPTLRASCIVAEGFCRRVSEIFDLPVPVRPDESAVQSAFGIDRDKRRRILSSRVAYLAALPLHEDWYVEPARRRALAYLEQAEALGPDPSLDAQRALVHAVCAEVQPAVRCFERLGPARTRRELRHPLLQLAILRRGGGALFERLGLAAPGLGRRGGIVWSILTSGLRRRLSPLVVRATYASIVTPAGVAWRVLRRGTFAGAAAGASCWKPYSHVAASPGATSRLGRIGTLLGFFFERRKLAVGALAVLLLVLLRLALGVAPPLPYIYTLF